MRIGAKAPKIADKTSLPMVVIIQIIPHFTMRVNPIINAIGKLIFEVARRHPYKAGIARSAMTHSFAGI
jgi:hypothetical protein